MTETSRATEEFPPCKHCKHEGIDHDKEFGFCFALGIIGDWKEPGCECPGYEADEWAAPPEPKNPGATHDGDEQ